MPELFIAQSEIATFMRCRRKWYVAHYRELGRVYESPTGPAPLGTRVHNAVASHYLSKDPFETLSREYTRDRAEFPEFEEELRKDQELATAMVEGYLEWLEEEGEDAGLTVIGVEENVSVPYGNIDGYDVTLVAKYDLRVKRDWDNARLFMDHKTVGNLADLPKLAQIALQFKHYCLLDRLSGTDDSLRCDGGVYNMMRKVKRTRAAKPPFFGRFEVRHSDDSLRSYWTQLNGVLQDMISVRRRLDAGENPHKACYPNPMDSCSYSCPVYNICPHFDSGDAEGSLAEHFAHRDPLERYQQQEEVNQ